LMSQTAPPRPPFYEKPIAKWLGVGVGAGFALAGIAGQHTVLIGVGLLAIAGVLGYVAETKAGWIRWVAIGSAIIVALGALFLFYKKDLFDAADATPPITQAPTTSQPSTGTTPAKPALAAAWEYPWLSGCANFTQIGMPSGGGRIEDFHSPSDVRGVMTSGQGTGGTWAKGVMFLDLSTVDVRSVDVIDIQPHITRRDLGSPQWIYKPLDGCGQPFPDRSFTFDLDGPSFTDDGVPTNAGPVPSEVPTAPLGPDFVLDGQNHAGVRIDTRSCHGNYEWNLDIQYTEGGSSQIEVLTLGPFVSFGLANNTTVYSGYQGKSGAVDVQMTDNLTGTDPIFCR